MFDKFLITPLIYYFSRTNYCVLVLRLALIQLKVGSVKSVNLSRAKELVKEAVQNKANIVCLPVSLSTDCEIIKLFILQVC